MARRFLRYCELKERGIVPNRVQLARSIESYDFPRPVELGANSIAWYEDEIEDWLASRRRRTPKATTAKAVSA